MNPPQMPATTSNIPSVSSPTVDVDSIIKRLLDGRLRILQSSTYFVVKNARPGKRVNLLENEIAYLCQKSRQIFLSQPVLLELEAPIKVCGMKW